MIPNIFFSLAFHGLQFNFELKMRFWLQIKFINRKNTNFSGTARLTTKAQQTGNNAGKKINIPRSDLSYFFQQEFSEKCHEIKIIFIL
jgi:hypothetical protein